MMGRDVFVCHATVDKVTHARPLRDALNARGVSCWLDEAQILPGESIVEKIGEGISTSRIVVVLITAAFLGRNWPEKELNVALSREIRRGQTTVIPVISVDVNKYLDRYPLLEDKLFLDWQEGPQRVADHLAVFFPRKPESEWHCNHPAEHVGLVWVRLIPAVENIGVRHDMILRWGPYIKEVPIIPDSSRPISLLHHKTNPDSVTLHVSVNPPSIVTFGQGVAPDTPHIAIDEGWTRTAGGYWPGHL